VHSVRLFALYEICGNDRESIPAIETENISGFLNLLCMFAFNTGNFRAMFVCVCANGGYCLYIIFCLPR